MLSTVAPIPSNKAAVSSARPVRIGGGPGRSGRHYRLMNEVPTLLMVVIVASVIVRF